MKKIFAVLFAIVLVLSMSITGFAAEESKESYTVVVKLTDGVTKVVDKDTGAQHKVFTFDVAVTNNTKENMYMKDIDIEVNAVDAENDEEVIYASEVKWDRDVSKTIINIDGTESAGLICEVPTNHEVYLKVSVDGGSAKTIKQIGESKSFTIEPTTSTTTTTTTTTTEATKPAETETSTTTTTTTTIAPTESTKSNTAVIIMGLPDSPNTEAPIEDEIPNTGSTKAIYAAAALAIAGAVALLIIKKKSDD